MMPLLRDLYEPAETQCPQYANRLRPLSLRARSSGAIRLSQAHYATNYFETIGLWLVLLVLFCPIALILSYAISYGSTFLPMLVVFLWFLAALVCFMLAIWLALDRALWRALAILIVPLSFIALFEVKSVMPAMMAAGDYVHIYAMMPFYLFKISRIPIDQGPKLAVFSWSVSFLDVESAALYDESDGFRLTEQSAAWKERVSDTQLKCGITGMPAGWHFYVVYISC